MDPKNILREKTCNQRPGHKLSKKMKKAQRQVKENQKIRQQKREERYGFLAGPENQKTKTGRNSKFKV